MCRCVSCDECSFPAHDVPVTHGEDLIVSEVMELTVWQADYLRVVPFRSAFLEPSGDQFDAWSVSAAGGVFSRTSNAK